MSGGYFECSNYIFNRVAEQIEQVVETGHDEDCYEYTFGDDTREQMRQAVWALKLAAIYMNRVDYLLSGDDSEESFHQRLRKELRELDAETRKNNQDWRDRYMDSFCAEYIEQNGEK
jgi:siroheme synthase (precorrin-2 oxidase/ferrochelatase)